MVEVACVGMSAIIWRGGTSVRGRAEVMGSSDDKMRSINQSINQLIGTTSTSNADPRHAAMHDNTIP